MRDTSFIASRDNTFIGEQATAIRNLTERVDRSDARLLTVCQQRDSLAAQLADARAALTGLFEACVAGLTDDMLPILTVSYEPWRIAEKALAKPAPHAAFVAAALELTDAYVNGSIGERARRLATAEERIKSTRAAKEAAND